MKIDSHFFISSDEDYTMLHIELFSWSEGMNVCIFSYKNYAPVPMFISCPALPSLFQSSLKFARDKISDAKALLGGG